MTALRQHLEDRLAQIAELVVSPSQFGAGDDAYWIDGKEILHFDEDDVVDIRLTRAEICERRPVLRDDSRVHLRASSSSEWLEVRFAEPADVDFIVQLAHTAAAAHRRH